LPSHPASGKLICVLQEATLQAGGIWRVLVRFTGGRCYGAIRPPWTLPLDLHRPRAGAKSGPWSVPGRTGLPVLAASRQT